MRAGFTTGSCATAAAKAATYMLLSGKKKQTITIETPKGIRYTAQILEITQQETMVQCAVIKDGGDDPDVTTGTLIYAEVTFRSPRSKEEKQVQIDGGVGVGRVTKPGLDQPVGEAAINRVPREMIEKEVEEVCRLFDYQGGIHVLIFVPEGESLANKTFNPRLGIVGGISILGTSGIVEPMSSRAIIETIRVEFKQRRAEGYDYAAVSPGNYGLDFMKNKYGYDLNRSIKCSNYVGEMIDIATELGFRKILFTGHIGKLIKVAGGIMNTHSKEADARLELLAAFALQEHVEPGRILEMMHCVTTEEAVRIIKESIHADKVWNRIVERICYYMENRSGRKLHVDCILYTNEFGELAKSKEVKEWFTLLEQEQERWT